MAKCDFSLELSGSAEELVNSAGPAIRQAGGAFSGDASAGDFELPTPLGTVKGTYSVLPSTIRIQIMEKPMLVGCGRIEDELRRRLGR